MYRSRCGCNRCCGLIAVVRSRRRRRRRGIGGIDARHGDHSPQVHVRRVHMRLGLRRRRGRDLLLLHVLLHVLRGCGERHVLLMPLLLLLLMYSSRCACSRCCRLIVLLLMHLLPLLLAEHVRGMGGYLAIDVVAADVRVRDAVHGLVHKPRRRMGRRIRQGELLLLLLLLLRVVVSHHLLRVLLLRHVRGP